MYVGDILDEMSKGEVVELAWAYDTYVQKTIKKNKTPMSWGEFVEDKYNKGE